MEDGKEQQGHSYILQYLTIASIILHIPQIKRKRKGEGGTFHKGKKLLDFPSQEQKSSVTFDFDSFLHKISSHWSP